MVYPLSPVTKSSQKEAENWVKNLEATNDEFAKISDGLQMGLDIIKDRSNSSGRVAAIMLLARNNVVVGHTHNVAVGHTHNVAVHTFGLGEGYTWDLSTLSFKSKGGTFSDVPVAENLTKAVSVCLAGLLTVAIQDLTLTISPIEEEATLRMVSYKYQRRDDGSLIVEFGDLYSDEVRKILVELQLPNTDKERISNVLKISCSYKVKEVLFEPEPVIVTVRRMIEVPSYQRQPQPEVIAELCPQKILGKISQFMHDGNKKEIIYARDMLKEMVKGEPGYNALLETMWPELQNMVGQNQEVAARSFAASCWTSHWRQRAAARGIKPENFMVFYTLTMVEFLKQAEEFRARILDRGEEIISPSPDEES